MLLMVPSGDQSGGSGSGADGGDDIEANVHSGKSNKETHAYS
jgi:hypothetical protein